MVKVFYVTNATSVQEFQEIATAIRTVAEIRRVFTYNAQKAMMVRGTLDQVALAEKLIHDLDKPKAEVVVDVIVMEANSDAVERDLAATIVNSTGTPGLNVPFLFAPTNTVTNPITTGGTARRRERSPGSEPAPPEHGRLVGAAGFAEQSEQGRLAPTIFPHRFRARC